MRVTLDAPRVERVSREAMRDALTDAGLEVARHAQTEAPVDTGNLRRNIEFTGVDGTGRTARVVSKAPYSIYVHEGTRYQRANRFLTRAVGRARA